ncbi:hypothetical protein RHS03_06684, partial [Rhizoctonia solani]
MDPELFEEFMQFRAFKQAADAKQKVEKEQDCKSTRGHSLTIGCNSSPMDTHKEQCTEDKDDKNSLIVGHSSNPTDVDVDLMPTPLPCLNTKQNKGKDCAKKPKQDERTSASDKDKQVAHTSTPCAFCKQDELNKNAATKNCKRVQLLEPGPWQMLLFPGLSSQAPIQHLPHLLQTTPKEMQWTG